MFTPGKLIYFDPFHFKDGKDNKPKFFLVLKAIGNTAVLASLPSSIPHLPGDQIIKHGCLELPDSGINCFVIEGKKPITKEGWAFPLDTFLHGFWLDDYEIDYLKTILSIPKVDYEIIGEILDEELKAIVSCFANSSIVKRKFKKLLQ